MEQITISPKDSPHLNYIEEVIELFFYLKENLDVPFLGNLTTSVPLTQFLLNILQHKEHQYTNSFKITYNSIDNFKMFKKEYLDEIVISYNLINNFLSSHNKFISKNSWESFCYYYSV